MRCPPALLAATFLLQVTIFYWKFICLIEDAKPNWENLGSVAKQRPLSLKAMRGEVGASLECRIALARRRRSLVAPPSAANISNVITWASWRAALQKEE